MRCAAALVCLLAPCISVVSATTYLVRPDGTGDFPTIQAAINAAANGDTVALANGTFTGDGNRDLDLLGKAVSVQSVSGDPTACVIDCQGSYLEFHSAFFLRNAETSETKIVGIGIIGGWNQSAALTGGILCDGAAPTIIRCRFSGNTGVLGGGLHCSNGASPEVRCCQFSENDAIYGGGIYCGEGCSPVVSDCEFSLHNGPRLGGGIYCVGGGIIIEGCSFRDNRLGAASAGGGLCIEGSPTSDLVPMIDRCAFTNNRASTGGGVSISDMYSMTISNSTFRENIALQDGGGIFVASLFGPTIEGCVFAGNYAVSDGGGICCGGTTQVLACRIESNKAGGDGGGVAFQGYSPALLGCTISMNQADYDGGLGMGGGLWCYGSSSEVTGCTFSHNWPWTVSVEAGSYLTANECIIAFTVQGDAVACSEDSDADVSCCDIYDDGLNDWRGCIADQDSINGNFSADPCFCDAENGDYRLWNYSPCAQEGCGLIGAWPVGCEDPMAVGPEPVAQGLSLSVWPNPVGGAAQIRYALPTGGEQVDLGIYDVGGRLVRSFRKDGQASGSLVWDGKDALGRPVGTGAYFVHLRLGNSEVATRLVVVR